MPEGDNETGLKSQYYDSYHRHQLHYSKLLLESHSIYHLCNFYNWLC